MKGDLWEVGRRERGFSTFITVSKEAQSLSVYEGKNLSYQGWGREPYSLTLRKVSGPRDSKKERRLRVDGESVEKDGEASQQALRRWDKDL